MYILKEQFEDFLVDEVLSREILVSYATAYHVYLLKKQNYTTERAVRAITKAVHKPRNAISYAGTKDKQAITTQYVVLRGVSKEQVEKLELKDIELSFVGYAAGHLRLGDLAGNRFTLIVRNLDAQIAVPENFYVPNYFDEQRFSTANVQIGMFLMKKEFSEATKLLQEFDKDFAEPIAQHLAKLPNDHIGALRLLPRKTLLFYVHAVQSKIYNDLLAKYIQELGDVTLVPYSQGEFAFPKTPLSEVAQKEFALPGFESDAYESFLQENYGLGTRNFLLPSMPELSLPGNMRVGFNEVKECSAEFFADDLHEGKKKAKVSFVLGKGSYATIVIRQLFSRNASDA